MEIGEQFPANCGLEIMKARNFSSGMRQVRDETASDRIGHPGEDDRDGTGGVKRCRNHRICSGKDHIRRKPYYFLCHAAHPLLAFTAEPVIEPDVTALCPAQILQSLSEGRKIGLPNFVALSEAHNDADTPHSIALLRSCPYRPCSRCAAQNTQEISPSHFAP